MACFYKGVSFDYLYKRMLTDLVKCSEFRCAPRGLLISENLAVTYELEDPTRCLIDFSTTAAPERQEVYDKYRKAELEWYSSGSLTADSAPSKFWLGIADRHGNITSNYGHMMMHDRKYPGDKTALEHVVDTLVKDPSSRQAITHYNMPAHYFYGNKDIPCTLSHQFLIREGALYMIATMRSVDIILGLAYDAIWFVEFMQIVAQELSKRGVEVKLGTFTHHMGSLHLYDNKLELAKKIIEPRFHTEDDR